MGETMRFILYPFLAIFNVLFTLFSVVFVNWWAPLFAFEGTVYDRGVATQGTTLPKWLKWFDTFDASLDAGLAPGALSTYWTRLCWLYRNPSYGFGYWVLGAKFEPEKWSVKKFNPHTDEKDFTFIAKGPGGLFNIHVIRFGWRWKLGWKAWNYYKLDGSWEYRPWGPEMRMPLTCSLSRAK